MEVDEELLKRLAEELENFPKGLEQLPRHFQEGRVVSSVKSQGVFKEFNLEIYQEDLDLAIYYSGLAVLCRDMHLYLLESPREDAADFEEIFSSVVADDKKLYPTYAYPHTEPGSPFRDLLSKQYEGMAVSAAEGLPTVRQLGQTDIVRESNVKPGKRLWDKFKRKLKKVICGKNGPYEQFENGLIGQAALPSTIASAILTAGFSVATFWYPLVVYIAILLIKTGLKTYCEE